MKVAVLFDGAGLARLGLERAGHICTGVDLDPVKHHFSQLTGSGRCELGDARDFDLTGYDAIWMSPPCAQRSTAIKDLTRKGGYRNIEYQQDHLEWCLTLKYAGLLGISWIENVTIQGSKGNDWGRTWNAAQFLEAPLQNRNRVIGGVHDAPKVFRPYRRWHPGICPTISATEYKGCASDRLRASRYYGRKLTVQECAYHQGFEIPSTWFNIPDWFMPDYRHRAIHWERKIYEAIGDGVPVYMAQAFGQAARDWELG